MTSCFTETKVSNFTLRPEHEVKLNVALRPNTLTFAEANVNKATTS